MHSSMMSICEVFARKNERSESELPELLAYTVKGCQKKWLLHYGNTTILGSPELSRQVCLAEGMHLGGSSPLSILPQWMAKPFWTTMVYHYGVYMGETVYIVEIS